MTLNVSLEESKFVNIEIRPLDWSEEYEENYHKGINKISTPI